MKNKSFTIIVKRKKIHSVLCEKILNEKGRVSIGYYNNIDEFFSNIKLEDNYEQLIINFEKPFCRCCKKQLLSDYPLLKRFDK